MTNIVQHRTLPALSLMLALTLFQAGGVGSQAQPLDSELPPVVTNTVTAEVTEDPAPSAFSGPVRLARFSYVSGNVTWRPDARSEWSAATLNMPLRQDAQIWITEGGRAEIQFDDGSLLRLGNGAVATLQTLYSDSDGEFTEITLAEGLAYLHLKQDHSIYQVDTPLVSVKAVGPAKLRIGAGEGVEIGVRTGRASVEGSQGNKTLAAGDYLDLQDANSAYNTKDYARTDSWECWNAERERQLAKAEENASAHLPSNIAIVANDLDSYGSWRNDNVYGYVWCPRVNYVDWRPYHYGHWTWVNPFGWTWVSDEPWGWAPYHYGTWVYQPYGWAWVPGPVHQYWSPGVVHFSECDGRVAWVPLCPSEVRYPSALAIGFRKGHWATYFSIGAAAVYYPTYNNYCVARPFNTTYINRVTYVNNVTIVQGSSTSTNRYQRTAEYFAANHNTYLGDHRFVPQNARLAAGVSVANASAFGGRGSYQAPSRTGVSLFERGRVVGAPAGNRAPVAGPPAVKPTSEALAPTRTFVREAGAAPVAQKRTIYHTPVKPASKPVSSSAGPNKPPTPTAPSRPTSSSPGPSTPSRPTKPQAPVATPSRPSGAPSIPAVPPSQPTKPQAPATVPSPAAPPSRPPQPHTTPAVPSRPPSPAPAPRPSPPAPRPTPPAPRPGNSSNGNSSSSGNKGNNGSRPPTGGRTDPTRR